MPSEHSRSQEAHDENEARRAQHEADKDARTTEREGRQADQRQRQADREAYRDQWIAEHPGEEFPGFPPELTGQPERGNDLPGDQPEDASSFPSEETTGGGSQ